MTRSRPEIEPLDLHPILSRAEALLIVPPFAQLELPAMSPHVLQAAARAAGRTVAVLYANVLFARHIGAHRYTRFIKKNTFNATLPGERLFARAAHDLPPFGLEASRMYDDEVKLGARKAIDLGGVPYIYPACEPMDLEDFAHAERTAGVWAEEVARALLDLGFSVVGCTSSFEQNNAALALLQRIKQQSPDTVTILGGANCSGDMALGVRSLDPDRAAVDHVFSGESEQAFVDLLASRGTGERPPGLVRTEGPHDLDELAPPDYAEFFDQLEHFLPGFVDDNPDVGIAYETSRGCYWRGRGGCTFCGLNLDGVRYRVKSADRVREDLRQLHTRHPGRVVAMADNTMPRGQLSKLTDSLPPTEFFYSVRPDMTLRQVLTLKEAGVVYVLPGVESLVTEQLEQMNKGVTARHNLMFLRYARSAGIFPYYNLLWGFPGDQAAWYERTLELLRLMPHLSPPRGIYHLSIDRFSPMFERPGDFGVRDVRPLPSYAYAYPEGADVEHLAYHFVGDYDSGSYQVPDVMRRIIELVDAWRARWMAGESQLLQVARMGAGFLLVDTRNIDGGIQGARLISPEQARAALIARPADDGEHTRWALDHRLGVLLDGDFVPLPTADPGLLLELEPALP